MKLMVIEIKHYKLKVRPYLNDKINDLKKCDTWKIQLTIAINFISHTETNPFKV